MQCFQTFQLLLPNLSKQISFEDYFNSLFPQTKEKKIENKEKNKLEAIKIEQDLERFLESKKRK